MLGCKECSVSGTLTSIVLLKTMLFWNKDRWNRRRWLYVDPRWTMWYVHKNILGTRRDAELPGSSGCCQEGNNAMVKKKVVLKTTCRSSQGTPFTVRKTVCYECLKEIFYGEHARAEWKKNHVGVSGKLRSVSERYRVVWLCGICIDNYCTLNKLKW